MFLSSYGYFSGGFANGPMQINSEPSHARVVGPMVAMSANAEGVTETPVTFNLDWYPGTLRAAYRFPLERYGIHAASEVIPTDAFNALGFVATSDSLEVILGTGGKGVHVAEQVTLPDMPDHTKRHIVNTLDYLVKKKSIKLLGSPIHLF